jgi:predicted nucleic acid-binding protein
MKVNGIEQILTFNNGFSRFPFIKAIGQQTVAGVD